MPGPMRRFRLIQVLLIFSVLVLFQTVFFSFQFVDDFQAKEERFYDAQASSRVAPKQLLPHWRIGTDCSSYSLDCFAVARRENKYLPYPFSYSVRKSLETSLVEQSDEWSVQSIEKLPGEWIEYLETKETMSNIPIKERNYIYPPMVTQDKYQTCIDLAITQNKSTMEQIDELMSGDSPRITPEADTNMVAFTISDYSYVQDMLHDVFQMMDDIVGFSSQHFFLVAIDEKSVELACKYGYPVVKWKADENNLRDAVANTKLIVSHELVKRGIDFFFSEMDVWWIRSPKPNLVQFQKKHDSGNDKDHSGKHFYVSGHQNKFHAPNIGVYAAKADKHTEEYFRLCIDVLNKRPETHDQYVMHDVHRLFMNTYHGKQYQLKGRARYQPGGPPETPEVKYPFEALLFSPHEIVADERPMTTQLTLAIHTLNSTPLQTPHGKLMKAKELGVYYGFHSHYPGIFVNNAASGYYDRSGEHRRYLWLDTEVRNNLYSIAHPNRYQEKPTLEWTLAILIAFARKTNRILVLPQVFQARHDSGVYFAWSIMDYSNVTDMVDFRETNFLTNPKAWKNRSDRFDNEFWPFESVVNTGLFKSANDENTTMIYTQSSDRSSIVSNKVWNSAVPEHEWLDAWVGSLSATPELDSAEVLLVNPDLLMDKDVSIPWFRRVKNWQKTVEQEGINDSEVPPIGRMEREVLEIYNLLGWCWGKEAFEQTGSKISASNSCYGKGTPNTKYP